MFSDKSHRVAELADEVEPVHSTTLCTNIYRILSGDPDLVTLPVVDEGQPVGLVSRSDFLVSFANQYGRALYEGKPIRHLMDPSPLIVDAARSSWTAHAGSRNRPTSPSRRFSRR